MIRSLALAALALAAPQDPAAGPERVLESAHYRLVAVGDLPEAEGYLKLAEALHERLTAHFGVAPRGPGKLEIRFWATVEGYKSGASAEGVPAALLEAGGVYWTGTRRAYFWRQPSPYGTRHLFLHELTHQFHYLAVMDNSARAPAWYCEGLAEHFAWHRWDGEKLECGQSDVLALEQRIPQVVEKARRGEYDLAAILSGRERADYGSAWAAVHFLLSGPDRALTARFRAEERRLWLGKKGDVAAAILGPRPAAASEAARRFLSGLATTWKIEWIAWDAVGRDVVGESQTVAIVRTRREHAAPVAIEATAEAERGRAGLVAGFRSTDEFLAMDAGPDGAVRLLRRRAGKWEVLASARVARGASRRLRLEVAADGRLAASVEGKEVASARLEPGAAAGPVGLLVDGGRCRFSDFRLPESPR
ncbi:MAG: hypothetical protein L0216_19860 [Planctomycetales bacterium]|nr:hypothetical protein [Planctomycetales bacterium]